MATIESCLAGMRKASAASSKASKRMQEINRKIRIVETCIDETTDQLEDFQNKVVDKDNEAKNNIVEWAGHRKSLCDQDFASLLKQESSYISKALQGALEDLNRELKELENDLSSARAAKNSADKSYSHYKNVYNDLV